MAYKPTCPGCHIARQAAAAALTAIALGMPLVAARETGWLTEDPPPVVPPLDHYGNTTISASASAVAASSDVYGGFVVIERDTIPDDR